MAKLPVTVNLSVAVSGGTATATVTRVDGNGVSLHTDVFELPADVSLDVVLGKIRNSNRRVIGDYLTLADLPASFSVQIGLDTSLRELDLL